MLFATLRVASQDSPPLVLARGDNPPEPPADGPPL